MRGYVCKSLGPCMLWLWFCVCEAVYTGTPSPIELVQFLLFMNHFCFGCFCGSFMFWVASVSAFCLGVFVSVFWCGLFRMWFEFDAVGCMQESGSLYVVVLVLCV
jgi:hypothetical protein